MFIFSHIHTSVYIAINYVGYYVNFDYWGKPHTNGLLVWFGVGLDTVYHDIHDKT